MQRILVAIVAVLVVYNCNAQKNNQMEKVNIQLIRNASLKLNYAGKTILVDPMISAKESFMSFVQSDKNLNPVIDLPISAEDVIGGVDAVLLTHAHPDHLDPKAIEILPKNIPFFAQVADKEALSKTPFQNITLVDTKSEYDGISIIRTDGKHGPDQLLEALGTVSGYILQADGFPTIYIVGDCLLDDTVEKTIENYRPDIIITNSGGAMFMGENRILMDAEETIAVAQKAPYAKVVAVHMEALDHCTVTREAMKSEAKKTGVEIMVPDNGEMVVL
jgi:L-ascorbate metabolism protein UlaG (beta-lactamase superfamily)